MGKALDVARYLIRLAASEKEPDVLTHLRLQKLLYYVQGWHLGTFGRPLFQARIEAWTHGPVVRELFSSFKDYKNGSIPPEQGGEAPSLTAVERAFVRAVWEEYKDYSPSGLWKRTHTEAPWRQARGGLRDDEKSDAEITEDSLRAFFAPQTQEREREYGISAERVALGIEQLDRTGGRPHKEVFARLRGG